MQEASSVASELCGLPALAAPPAPAALPASTVATLPATISVAALPVTISSDLRNLRSVTGRPLITAGEIVMLERLPPLPNLSLPLTTQTPAIMPMSDGPSFVRGGTRLRPSSASANLQTHPSHSTGLFDVTRSLPVDLNGNSGLDRGPRTDGNARGAHRPRPKTGGPKAWCRSYSGYSPGQQRGSGVVGEKGPRRLTITGAERGVDTEAVSRSRIVGKRDQNLQLRTKIEERISISVLDELKQAFSLADTDGNGKLDYDQFKAILKAELNILSTRESQIDALFQKIDCMSQGSITWDEFCTYMQLEYAELEDSYLRTKKVSFVLPALSGSLPHRDPVLRVMDLSDGSFLTCSRDGVFVFWTPNMNVKRKKCIVPIDIHHRVKTKWITDFVILPQYNKLIVSTGDREIQFYELSSFEPYCQISGFDTVPLRLDYSFIGNDECLIMFGDKEGCVNILWIASAGECLRMWKKAEKTDGIVSIGLDQVLAGGKAKFVRWKVHGDWVHEIKYYHELRQIISCSNHEPTALVIGCTMGSTHVEQQLKEIRESQLTGDRRPTRSSAWQTPKLRVDMDQTVFRIYKGVKCFDFAKSRNVIATGGMDRIVRIWNPYVNAMPVAMLHGHMAPICFIFIAEEENRLFSISTDRCIKIWDIQDQNCLLTVRTKSHRIRTDITSCYYSHMLKTLAIATIDQMNALTLKIKGSQQVDVPLSHNEPVHAVVYTSNLQQVISASEGSIVKLWDLNTGAEIFQFGNAHGDYAITCMTLDNTGRRLVTAARDGLIKVWNYNNGQCLRILAKEKDNNEICALTYIGVNRNRFIVSVGWDRRVNIYTDHTTGTSHGVDHPQPNWTDDINNGHSEDILSVDYCPPNLLATSSYDGQVIVWNMVSGHIFCHLFAPGQNDDNNSPNSLDSGQCVNSVIFLPTRSDSKDAASLVSSGPRGIVHFWNVFGGGTLMARIIPSKMTSSSNNVFLTTLKTNKANTRLVSGDNSGFVNIWEIDNYCRNGPETSNPPLLYRWRGHLENVTGIVLVESPHSVIITSSLDCTVRVWTYQGEYIGVFGQSDAWNLYNPTSFQHPMVPFDVLIDPLSLPNHQVIEKREKTEDVLFNDEDETPEDEDEEDEEESVIPRQQSVRSNMTTTPRDNLLHSRNSCNSRVTDNRLDTAGDSNTGRGSNGERLQGGSHRSTVTGGEQGGSHRSIVTGGEEQQQGGGLLADIVAFQDMGISEETRTSAPRVKPAYSAKQPYYVDNETIAEMLKDARFKSATGKRLRHERSKPVKIDHGGPSEYQMLHVYHLDDTPKPDSPKHLKRNRDDPFNFFIDDNLE